MTYSLAEREDLFIPMIAKAFDGHGLDGCLGVAMACHESAGFRPDALNDEGRDKDRGGAYGLFQMTVLTAHDLGFTGPADELYDPATNIELTIKLMARNSAVLASHKIATTPSRLAAAHNCGVGRILHCGGIPGEVMITYVHPVMEFYAKYHKRVSEIIASAGSAGRV